MSPYQKAQLEIEQLPKQVASLTEHVKRLNFELQNNQPGAMAALKLDRDLYQQRYEMKNRSCNDLMRERMEMVAELRALHDDRLLLDWFDENNHFVEVDFPPGANLTTSSWAFYAPKDGQFNSVRNRLRAAMIEYSKPLVGGLFGNGDAEEAE
jgi:hypothetical protein